MNIKLILMLIGMFIMLGSVGAMEINNISILQCILQCLLGIGLTLPAVFDRRLTDVK